MDTERSLACLVLAGALYALGCSGPAPVEEGPPSCSDVCANITARCGATPPQCITTCASFSDAVVRCAAAASSCDAIDACGSSPGTDAGSSSGTDGGPGTDADVSNPDPCSACTGLQYCVRDSGGVNPRCWEPPDTCDDAPSVSCDDCVYRAGTGPCVSGARGCTSGGAGRTIDCM